MEKFKKLSRSEMKNVLGGNYPDEDCARAALCDVAGGRGCTEGCYCKDLTEGLTMCYEKGSTSN